MIDQKIEIEIAIVVVVVVIVVSDGAVSFVVGFVVDDAFVVFVD